MALRGEYAPIAPNAAYQWIRDQIQTWDHSGGTEGTTDPGGRPCIIVVNRGAKTGLLHRTPLVRVERDGHYLAVASRGGKPKNPPWVHNLRANPVVEVWDETRRADYNARELSGDERAHWWELAVSVFADYAEYAQKAPRVIPVFLLAPAIE